MKLSKLLTYLVNWQNNKSSSTCHFSDNSYEFWIDGAELGIVGIFRDFNIVIALFPFRRFAVYMPKFGASNAAKP